MFVPENVATKEPVDLHFITESIGYTMQNSDHMVLKGVNWVHNDKIRSNGLDRSNLVTQYKIRSYGLERSQLGTQ